MSKVEVTEEMDRPLAREIEDLEAKLAQLRRRALHATCQELGCNMVSLGGANCGCEFDVTDLHGDPMVVQGCCSVPVSHCTRCGDCDYGENAEAAEVRRQCAERNDDADSLAPAAQPGAGDGK